MPLHILYTDIHILLSRRPPGTPDEIRVLQVRYTTSLGPWSEAAVVAFLAEEYPDLWPSAREQVASFLEGPDHERVLTFADRRR